MTITKKKYATPIPKDLNRRRKKPMEGKRRKKELYKGVIRASFSSPEDTLHTADQTEFMMAVDKYKREKQRPRPEWWEILAIAHALGYRKVAEPEPRKRK